ncbi:MAG: hypothetical protein KJ043_13425, partial [Anaerolineae bacterium]|nr:hypothetical protein [Anaerolineae bacterium]
DDYIYLGYQTEMPRYTDWFPAANRYFGERVSWIAPTYPIRQIFSPIVANFIIHLGVYYVAIFSIYGVIQRLTHPNTAILTVLLMGHYPPFMRAVGWDYVDGFILACISLGLFFITQACYSANRHRLYLIGAGMMCMLVITSNIFYGVYMPIVILFALWLNHQHQRHAIIRCAFWMIFGGLVVYVLEGIYYNSLTGNWLTFTHSLTFSQSKFGDVQFQYINNVNFLKIFPTWHLLPIITLIITSVSILRKDKSPHLYPVSVLLIGSYSVLLIWEGFGHQFLRYLFYSSILIPMTFILFGILLDKYRISSPKTINRLVILTFCIPAIPFLVFSLMPYLFDTDVSAIIGIIFVMVGLIGNSKWGFIGIITGFTILGYVVGLTPFRQGFSIIPASIITYIPNRYEHQTLYMGATGLAHHINHRYARLDIATFRLWYANDPKIRTYHALASIYLRGGGRVIDDNDLPQHAELHWNRNTLYIPNNEVIILSSQHTPEMLYNMAQNALLPHGYQPILQNVLWIDDGDGGFYAVFITIEPI